MCSKFWYSCNAYTLRRWFLTLPIHSRLSFRRSVSNQILKSNAFNDQWCWSDICTQIFQKNGNSNRAINIQQLYRCIAVGWHLWWLAAFETKTESVTMAVLLFGQKACTSTFTKVFAFCQLYGTWLVLLRIAKHPFWIVLDGLERARISSKSLKILFLDNLLYTQLFIQNYFNTPSIFKW